MNKFVLLAVLFTIFAFATLSMSQETQAEIRKQNADDAEALEEKFKSFTADTPCVPDDIACIDGAFAKCANVMEGDKVVAKYQIQPCGPGTQCFVLPLVLKRGTSLTCSKYYLIINFIFLILFLKIIIITKNFFFF